MRIVVFDIKGKYAHFKKIYTNSSSLSYLFPPPTTVAGIVAAVLGKERDSYYKEFSSSVFRVAIKIVNPIRKMTHTLNYINAKGLSGLYNRTDPTQIPFELLTGEADEVNYRIYLWHKENDILKELSERIKNSKYAFPPYLGAAPFSCIISGGEIIDVEPTFSKEPIPISSIVNVEYIKEDSIKTTQGLSRIIKEIIPKSFNSDRVAEKIVGVIFDEKCTPLHMELNTGYLTVGNENVVMI